MRVLEAGESPGESPLGSGAFRPPVGLASGRSPEEWEVVFLQRGSDYEAGKGKGAKGCLVNWIVEAELPADSPPGADTPADQGDALNLA